MRWVAARDVRVFIWRCIQVIVATGLQLHILDASKGLVQSEGLAPFCLLWQQPSHRSSDKKCSGEEA